MVNTTSYSDRSRRPWRNLAYPQTEEILLYILLSVLLLVALNARGLWRYFSVHVVGSDRVSISGSLYQLHDWSGILAAQGRVVQALFWATVGFFTYLIVWIIYNFFIDARNDIVAGEYTHPDSYNRTVYWETAIGSKVLFFAVIASIGLFAFCCTRLLPLFAKLFFLAVNHFSFSSSLLGLLASIIGVSVLVHLSNILCRLFILSWRHS